MLSVLSNAGPDVVRGLRESFDVSDLDDDAVSRRSLPKIVRDVKLFEVTALLRVLAAKGGTSAMGKRALICEDDYAIRLLLDKLLIRHGLDAESVATGDEAAARLRWQTYDLVVLDLLIPGMSGYELVDVLEREGPHLLDRVVVVTAQHRDFLRQLPVAAVVRKPFDLAEFDRVVDRVLFRPPGPQTESRTEERL